MASRYIQVADVQSELEMTFSSSTSPTLATVTNWILEAEEEVDRETHTRWDAHDVTNEYLDCTFPTNIFLLQNRPLNSITSIQVNTGDDWTESWSTVTSTDYKILESDISKIMTKHYYYKDGFLRINYNAGYSTIPSTLKELVVKLVKKRYLMSRLDIAAGNTEYINIATTRIVSRSNENSSYKQQILDAEIQALYGRLGKKTKSRTKFFNIEVMSTNVRDRL